MNIVKQIPQELQHDLDKLLHTSHNDLDKLQTWVRQHISADIEPEDDYEQTLAFAKWYIDVFLEHQHEDPWTAVSALDGKSILEVAVSKGLDKFLANAEFNAQVINKSNKNQMTPLHLAAAHGKLETVRVLLELGANSHASNAAKQLPIHSAFFIPAIHSKSLVEKKQAIFSLLYHHAPATLTALDNSNNSLLQMACLHGLLPEVKMITKKAPELIETENNHRNYPIHTALLNGQYEIALYLLPLNNVCQQKDRHRQVALHLIAMGNNLLLLTSCIEYTKNIDVYDDEGKTPLLIAAQYGAVQSFKALLAAGANPRVKTIAGESAEMLAKRGDHQDILGII